MITTLRRNRQWLRLAALLPVIALVAMLTTSCTPKGDIRFLAVPRAGDQVNGVGWAIAIAGNRIYLGGTFTSVRNEHGVPVGSHANVAAFDKNTGDLIGGFRADTNGIVRTLAVLGNTVYLGGDFTTVNGAPRARLAAVDATTGDVLAFRADTNRVNKVAVGGNRLYVAGTFSTIGGVPRNRVAAVDITTGAVDETFNPDVNATVEGLAVMGDRSKVFIGGLYSSVHGTSTTRLTAIDGFTGEVVGPTFHDVSGLALDLALNPDGSRLAAALGEYGNQGALFNTTTGTKMFRQRCGGDAQAVAIAGDNFYTGNHEECEGNFDIRLVGNSMLTGERQTDWLPTFDRFWGVHDLATDGRILAVAGDFTRVAGQSAQGITVFEAAPPPPPAPVRLANGALWRYHDGPTVDDTWAAEGFDDSAWSPGAAQFGYGDGDEATVISYGPNAGNKQITAWFRTSFEATSIPATLTLDLMADDGAIVYLNGVEVVRDNVGDAPDTAALRAASGRSGSAENALRSFALPPELLRVGTNLIAVSVHQDSPGSSDLSFDAGLRSTAAG